MRHYQGIAGSPDATSKVTLRDSTPSSLFFLESRLGEKKIICEKYGYVTNITHAPESIPLLKSYVRS